MDAKRFLEMLSRKELFVGYVASCTCLFQCHHPFPFSPMIVCVCVCVCVCVHAHIHSHIKKNAWKGDACFLFFLCVQCTFESNTLILSK